jgi:hypothetical protein
LYGADAYVSIARAWQARGDHARAVEILEPLLAAASRTGWTASLAPAQAAYREAIERAATVTAGVAT